MTILFASAVPEITGVAVLIEPLSVFRMGLIGAVVSIVSVIGSDAKDRLPTPSLALAVIVWPPTTKAVAGVNDHVPAEEAVTVPRRVAAS